MMNLSYLKRKHLFNKDNFRLILRLYIKNLSNYIPKLKIIFIKINLRTLITV